MNITSKPIEPRQFDDALPERLLGLASVESAGANVVLRAGETEPSPFIVRLTREQNVRAGIESELDDPIAALAKSLIIEFDDVLDEVPGDLQLCAQDLRSQRREAERELAPLPVRLVPVETRLDRLAKSELVDIWLEVQPFDVVEVLGRLADQVEVISPPNNEPTPSKVSTKPEHTHRRYAWQSGLASFIGLALAAVLPLQALQVLADVKVDGGVVGADSKAALETFLRGTTSLSDEDFVAAQADFSQAAQGFREAESGLDDLHAGVTALASVIPTTDRTVDSVRALITAGRELSATALMLTNAADDLSSQQSLELTAKLNLLGVYLEQVLPHVQLAAAALHEVDPSVAPETYVKPISELKLRAPQIVTAMQEYLRLVNALSVMLGGEEKMRYLAVFQNNTELRPTGGFMGSFAEMDLDEGEVARMFVPGGGTYDVQGQLQAYVAAPGPLQLLKARWEFQDANWFPDFPSSAKKLLWFYSAAGGPTADGVVAINATFVVELLRLLGPVDMPGYGLTLDAENFIFETQKLVELEYDTQINAPKAIIGDLAPVLLDRLNTASVPTLLAVVDLVARGLEEKDIQFNFRSNDLQATVEDLGWSGSLKQTSGDYLMLVNTNLGGGKTDGVIDQDVQVEVKITADGTIENTVTVTKAHRGLKHALFTGSNNVDYIRLYVPEGSELLAASGFEIPDDKLFEIASVPLAIDEDLELHMQDLRRDSATGTDVWIEGGKTVFGNWMQTAVAETESVSFTYRLPQTLNLSPNNQSMLSMIKQTLGLKELVNYSMLIQKQSGVQSRVTHVDITLPPNLSLLWSSSGDIPNLHFDIDNATDSYAGWLLERN